MVSVTILVLSLAFIWGLVIPSIFRADKARRRLYESERRAVVEAARARAHLKAGAMARAAKPLEPWTLAEREAFGINDTERFIRETDRVLKELEWEQIKARQEAEWAALDTEVTL